MQEISSELVAENLQAVFDNIKSAATKSGRSHEDISLVTVSKTFSAEITKYAVDAGAVILGESRVQEGCDKIDKLGRIAQWHMIGHLQTNKAAIAVQYFDLIHSIDSLHLAEKISQSAVGQEKTIDCLVEYNSSGEDSKFGFTATDLELNIENIVALPGINLKGLMTIGPWTTNEGCVRKAFEITQELFERIKSRIGNQFDILSMGMSSDYELAIECGSTMVRVGTAIFGVRNK